MNRLLLAGVAAASLAASSALAADLPSRRYAPVAPAPVVPIFTWTGFYIGANAGYGFGSNDDGDLFFDDDDDDFFLSRNGNNDGFVGGGQAGYNYQIGQFVVGLETDIQYADMNRLDYFGTARGRLGLAFNRSLLYATGGFAYGGGGESNGCFNGSCNGNDDVRGGYTVGGGFEYAFTNNLTAKVEGLYVAIDHNNTGFNNSNENEFGVVRAGVNYKFW